MPSRRRVVAAAAILAVAPAALRAQPKPRQIGFLGVSHAYEKQSKAPRIPQSVLAQADQLIR